MWTLEEILNLKQELLHLTITNPLRVGPFSGIFSLRFWAQCIWRSIQKDRKWLFHTEKVCSASEYSHQRERCALCMRRLECHLVLVWCRRQAYICRRYGQYRSLSWIGRLEMNNWVIPIVLESTVFYLYKTRRKVTLYRVESLAIKNLLALNGVTCQTQGLLVEVFVRVLQIACLNQSWQCFYTKWKWWCTWINKKAK